MSTHRPAGVRPDLQLDRAEPRQRDRVDRHLKGVPRGRRGRLAGKRRRRRSVGVRQLELLAGEGDADAVHDHVIGGFQRVARPRHDVPAELDSHPSSCCASRDARSTGSGWATTPVIGTRSITGIWLPFASTLTPRPTIW